jgi:hypothetical protein
VVGYFPTDLSLMKPQKFTRAQTEVLAALVGIAGAVVVYLVGIWVIQLLG